MVTAEAQWITTSAEFEALHGEWNELLRRSRCQSVFLTWEWLYNWWRHIDMNDSELQILTARAEDGRLIGIGPFCATRAGVAGPRVLKFLGTTRVSSDYLDVISEIGSEAHVADVMVRELLADSCAWDLVVLSDVLDSSWVMRELKPRVAGRKVTWDESLSQRCPYLSLPQDKDTFLKTLGPETRATLRRKTKKLVARGMQIEIAHRGDLLAARLDALFILHGRRWALRNHGGNLEDDAIRTFHRDVAGAFLANDWLRLFSMTIDDQVVASLYTFRYGTKLFYYQAGFDPAWSSYSTGAVLMGQAIEHAIDEGLVEFDYLRGAEPYKRRWTKTQRDTHCLTFVPEGRMNGYMYFRGTRLLRSCKNLAKRILLGVASRGAMS